MKSKRPKAAPLHHVQNNNIKHICPNPDPLFLTLQARSRCRTGIYAPPGFQPVKLPRIKHKIYF